MTVLVTGASGNVGRAVTTALSDRGLRVRAASRHLSEGEVPRGVEVSRVDLTRPEGLGPALAGVTSMFLYVQGADADGVLSAARSAGVERIVLLSSASVAFADADRNPIAAAHLDFERALIDGGFGWTFIRPAYFATNALRWTSIRTDGVVRTAFPHGSTPMVHERDIADLAVSALLDDGSIGSVFNAFGDGPLEVTDQVATIGRAIGREIAVEELDVETYRAELSRELPPTMVERLIAGKGSAPLPSPEVATDSVRAVLGRDPLAFSVWAEDHAADFR